MHGISEKEYSISRAQFQLFVLVESALIPMDRSCLDVKECHCLKGNNNPERQTATEPVILNVLQGLASVIRVRTTFVEGNQPHHGAGYETEPTI